MKKTAVDDYGKKYLLTWQRDRELGWTAGIIYGENAKGNLVDDDGFGRLSAEYYNHEGSKRFVELKQPKVGDTVRIKTKEEMVRDHLIGGSGRPAHWVEYMEKNYYGRILSVRTVGSIELFAIGNGYIMHTTAIAEILTGLEDTP